MKSVLILMYLPTTGPFSFLDARGFEIVLFIICNISFFATRIEKHIEITTT